MNSSSFHRNNIDTIPTTLNMNLNAFPDDHITFDPDPNYHSSSSLSCHDFFNYYDPGRFFHPQHQPDNVNYDNCNDVGYNTIPNNITNNLGLSLWQKDEHGQNQSTTPEKACNNPKKMKNPADRVALTTPTDRKPAASPETDQFSSGSSNNSLAAQSPIRVCSDCNTTKTPLWRSGPKGPKSLCNACGIRQRKARRAMEAAAGNGINQMTNAKLQQRKEKMPGRSSSGPPLQIKKRCRTTSTIAATKLSIVNGEKKTCFEDVLINLSKKLAVVHKVFPEEEKDAAILLMALSYGLVHG